jgi:GNAT superfamily N-acetyltransferase
MRSHARLGGDVIRDAIKEDFPRLMEMAEKFHNDSPDFKSIVSWKDSREHWERWIASCMVDDDGYCRAVGDDAVGFGIGRATPVVFCPSKKLGYGWAFWVDEDHRGNGHGRDMLRDFWEWTVGRGCALALIESNVFRNPKRMGKMFRKAGWQLRERVYTKRGVVRCPGSSE